MFSITNKDVWNIPGGWTHLPGTLSGGRSELLGADVPVIRAKDMATIHQPLDFLGLNIIMGKRCAPVKAGNREIVPDPAGTRSLFTIGG